MNNKAFVYVITNLLNGKKYVGVTRDMRRRMNAHASHTIATRAAIKNAIKKYGRENFQMEVLEEGEVDYCYEREPHWIEILGTQSPSGYNICFGGRGAKGLNGEMNGMYGRRGDKHPNFGKVGYRTGIPHTEETKEKMRLARLGRKHSPETIAKLKAAALARSPETKRKIQDAMRAGYAKILDQRIKAGACNG